MHALDINSRLRSLESRVSGLESEFARLTKDRQPAISAASLDNEPDSPATTDTAPDALAAPPHSSITCNEPKRIEAEANRSGASEAVCNERFEVFAPENKPGETRLHTNDDVRPVDHRSAQEDAEPKSHRRQLLADIAQPALETPRPPVSKDNVERFIDDSHSLEFQIGAKWLGWVGALVIVIAAAFFIKLAFDQGWIGKLPRGARCAICAAFGLTLVALGDLARRRIHVLAATGLLAAGLGTLYLMAYASFRYFAIVSETGAIVLMAMVAALGIVMTVRGQMLAIGILSLAGAYATPSLLHGGAAPAAAFPVYATGLLSVGLLLSLRRPEVFGALRSFLLVAHHLAAGAWAMQFSHEQPWLILGFGAIWWVEFAAHAVRAARRGLWAHANVVTVIATSAAFVVFGYQTLGVAGAEEWRGVFAALLVVVSVATAWQLAPSLLVFRKRPTAADAMLAVGLWFQAAALLLVAIAWQFTAHGQTLGYLVALLAAIEIGRRLESAVITRYGLICGGISFYRWLMLDLNNAALLQPLWRIGTIPMDGAALLGCAIVIALMYAGRRIAHQENQAWPVALSLFGAVLAGGLLERQADGTIVTAGWLVMCWLFLSFERFGDRQRYLQLSLVTLACTLIRWLIRDALMPRLTERVDAFASLPFLNVQFALALAIAATGIWAWRRVMARAATGGAAPAPLHADVVMIATTLVVLVAATFEIDHAVLRMPGDLLVLGSPTEHLRQTLWTILWSGGAAILLIVEAARRNPGRALLSEVGGAMLIACLAKWVVVDCFLAGLEITTLALQPIVNTRFVGAAAITGGLLLWSALLRRRHGESDGTSLFKLARWLPTWAAVVTLFALTLEWQRSAELLSAHAAASLAPWTANELFRFGAAALWAAGGVTMIARGNARPWRPLYTSGWALLLVTFVLAVIADEFAWNENGLKSAMPLLNLQCAAFLIVIGCVSHSSRIANRRLKVFTDDGFTRAMRGCAACAIVFAGFWLGTVESARFCLPEAGHVGNATLARQLAWSVFWSLYAVLLIGLGLSRRVAGLRRAGLALFGLTLAKILLIDMSEVQSVYRVLSLLATGLMLMAASIIYVRLSRGAALRAESAQEGV